MCTALSLTTKDHYFGRNLDLDRSYGEEVCVMPRRFPLVFRTMGEMREHHAMIGMATVAGGIPLFDRLENCISSTSPLDFYQLRKRYDRREHGGGYYPLFYEAANEYGLAMAGLNFPGNAYYAPLAEEKDNIAPFELIPWILGQCKTVEEANVLLARINLADIAFSESLPLSPLHWMICDREHAIVVEAMRDGLHIYENPVGVLTNNPPFAQHLENLRRYRHLRNDNAHVVREDDLPYVSYCQGLGAVGLPGDVSSMSRFARMVFGREHSVSAEDEMSSVGQFFHLLASVSMVKGTCKTDEGTWDITGYSACINLDRGLYYYTTYGNQRITCVNMHHTDLDSEKISCFPLIAAQSIQYQN